MFQETIKIPPEKLKLIKNLIFLLLFIPSVSAHIEEKLIKNVEDAAPLILKDLVQYKEGKTEITVFGVPHILEAGQIIVMQKNVSHSLKALTKFKMILTVVK